MQGALCSLSCRELRIGDFANGGLWKLREDLKLLEHCIFCNVFSTVFNYALPKLGTVLNAPAQNNEGLWPLHAV